MHKGLKFVIPFFRIKKNYLFYPWNILNLDHETYNKAHLNLHPNKPPHVNICEEIKWKKFLSRRCIIQLSSIVNIFLKNVLTYVLYLWAAWCKNLSQFEILNKIMIVCLIKSSVHIQVEINYKIDASI